MAAPVETSTVPGPDPTVAARDRVQRRQFAIAFAMVIGMVVVLVALYAAFSPESKDHGLSKQEQTDRALTRPPSIIPSPADGRAPATAGDPGGWEQLALFAVLILAFALIGLLIWRSSRKARAAQAAGLAATSP